MEWQGWFSLALTVSAVLILIFSKLGPHLVMMAALTILSLAGVLSPSEALQGFANPGLMTIAAMFVIAAGLQSSGAIEILVNRILGSPSSLREALMRVCLPVTLLSGFLNNTPVVATMIPAIRSWSRRINISPSKLMIPLSYASILGGTLTLIGSSTNIIVNGEYQVLTGDSGFSLFFITSLGLPVAIAGCLFMLYWFPKVLPDRNQDKLFGNLREFTLEVSVSKQGPLVGKTVEQAGLRKLSRVYLVEIERQGAIVTAVPSEEKLKGGDRLIFTGDTQAITDVLKIKGLEPSTHEDQENTLTLEHPERRLVEAVVSVHCAAVGSRIRDSRFRERYGAVVLAVARNGGRVEGNLGNIELKAGDTLLLEARPAFVSRQRYNKDFLLVGELTGEPLRHKKALTAWCILLAMVTAAGSGIISLLNAALLGAGLMLLTRCCSASAAERSLDLKVIITIGASFALGVALKKTGVADVLANTITDIGYSEPWLMLIIVYFSVSLLTEFITNNGAALIMLPIALAICEQAGLNHEPFVLAIMMAASASFITPLGYQTNLMVYGPGGYRFSDFVKVGVPTSLFVGFITVSTLLLFWEL